ncbi:heme-binding domain-containing protein [Paraflavitalea pollutisoli]|uniref:heme-binding domain-containing protein n=1 Tax=Paraflavitalea pollutisoli TaxID=3034143 RepID=UPI0023ED6639|nr:heme-binding domain-containing protein [Paraflavitalea sp. H1-2-19X]
MIKKIAGILLLILIGIQFIRPERNESTGITANDIAQQYYIPPDIQEILQRACYDCHSKNTEYPWYTNIQPVGWWMSKHIEDGKESLNFNEFGSYTPKDQDHVMDEIIEVVGNGEMPLPSYLWMHGEAKLFDDTAVLIDWARKLKKEIAATK